MEELARKVPGGSNEMHCPHRVSSPARGQVQQPKRAVADDIHQVLTYVPTSSFSGSGCPAVRALPPLAGNSTSTDRRTYYRIVQ